MTKANEDYVLVPRDQLKEARDLLDIWVPTSHPNVRLLLVKQFDEILDAPPNSA